MYLIYLLVAMCCIEGACAIFCTKVGYREHLLFPLCALIGCLFLTLTLTPMWVALYKGARRG